MSRYEELPWIMRTLTNKIELDFKSSVYIFLYLKDFFFCLFFWEVSSRHRGTLVIIQLSWIPKPSRVSGWPRYLDYPVASIDFNRSTQLLPLTGPRILGGAGLNAGDKI